MRGGWFVSTESGPFVHDRPAFDITPFSNGCLGSRNDEERSELRYVMRIAKPCESSNF